MTRKELKSGGDGAQDPTADRARLTSLRPFLEKRAAVLRTVRFHLVTGGFLEIETPCRISSPAPEIHIDTEPSGDRFLIASPELQMKRLVASGAYERIFQICHCFRRGERGERHLPEFSMLEWYRVDGDYEDLMVDCEELVTACAKAVGAWPLVKRNGVEMDLRAPWERLSVRSAFERHAGWTPGAAPDPDRFDRDLVDLVEPALPPDRPIFLRDYPASMASLAKISDKDETVAERVELYAGGLELANGFTELTDPAQQRARFQRDEEMRRAAGKPPYPGDERFLAALELGMPPCAGMALGMDRLVMLLTGAREIDDVVAFPEGTA